MFLNHLSPPLRVWGVVAFASLSACGGRQGGSEPGGNPSQKKGPPQHDAQVPYAGEPTGRSVPTDCAAQTSSGMCFSTVEAACSSLDCAGNRCSIGYSLPPMIGCARPNEKAWVPHVARLFRRTSSAASASLSPACVKRELSDHAPHLGRRRGHRCTPIASREYMESIVCNTLPVSISISRTSWTKTAFGVT